MHENGPNTIDVRDNKYLLFSLNKYFIQVEKHDISTRPLFLKKTVPFQDVRNFLL